MIKYKYDSNDREHRARHFGRAFVRKEGYSGINYNNLIYETGNAWLDIGTHEAFSEAAQFGHVIKKRQGLKISCLEDIAWRKQWLESKTVEEQVEVKKGNIIAAFTKYVAR